jgi:hypothetical protein
MAVTWATYSLTTTGWTQSDLAGLFQAAFNDAGLLPGGSWHDSFTVGSNVIRVLRVVHDATKTYGSSFYYFSFISSDRPGVSIASGWNTSTKVPTGTQFIDYHTLPANISGNNLSRGATAICDFAPSSTSAIFLDRITSGADAKQSWFVLRQGTNRSSPFSILRGDTSLHPWVDLDKGIISGYMTVETYCPNRMGLISFQLHENIRRCLHIGQALRGDTEAVFGSQRFHSIGFSTQSYCGVGSSINSTTLNLCAPVAVTSTPGAAFPLPVGKTVANSAYTVDYSAICTDLPWSPFTPARLALDLGLYMQYPDNVTVYGDEFEAQASTNVWKVMKFTNNFVVIDGASPVFLARTVGPVI